MFKTNKKNFFCINWATRFQVCLGMSRLPLAPDRPAEWLRLASSGPQNWRPLLGIFGPRLGLVLDPYRPLPEPSVRNDDFIVNSYLGNQSLLKSDMYITFRASLVHIHVFQLLYCSTFRGSTVARVGEGRKTSFTGSTRGGERIEKNRFGEKCCYSAQTWPVSGEAGAAEFAPQRALHAILHVSWSMKSQHSYVLWTTLHMKVLHKHPPPYWWISSLRFALYLIGTEEWIPAAHWFPANCTSP
jgi:hypothetical protein